MSTPFVSTTDGGNAFTTSFDVLLDGGNASSTYTVISDGGNAFTSAIPTPPPTPNPATDINGVVLGETPAGVPHFTIPFTVGNDGNVDVLQQDTNDEIIQCVAMLVGSRPGDRLIVPSYGITDPTFAGINLVELQNAAVTMEPRATLSVQVTPGGQEAVAVGVKGGSL